MAQSSVINGDGNNSNWQGVIEQDQVDSFDILSLFPCIKDMRRVIERNGSFEIVKMEKVDAQTTMDPEALVSHVREILHGTIANHFGKESADRLFARAMDTKLELGRSCASEIAVADF